MKKFVFLLTVLLLLCFAPGADAQEYGKIRPLRMRAIQIIKQKNDFVVQVLTSYAIPHERNSEGVVVRIQMNAQWHDVTAIEIVPRLQETGDKRQRVAAHELFFFTSGGILDLVSDLAIR